MILSQRIYCYYFLYTYFFFLCVPPTTLYVFIFFLGFLHPLGRKPVALYTHRIIIGQTLDDTAPVPHPRRRRRPSE